MAKPHLTENPAQTSHEQIEAQAHDADHSSSRLYWIIGIILAIVTIVEVFWPSIGMNEGAVVGGLMALMFLKGSMVVMYFMHLKGDPNIFSFVFVAPFLLAVSFVMAFLVLIGSHVGIAG
jgi:caa(3)-type oxidase subunit IV